MSGISGLSNYDYWKLDNDEDDEEDLEIEFPYLDDEED
jgi:hypothetical protein